MLMTAGWWLAGGGEGEGRERGGNEGGYEVEWWSEMSVIACFLCC